jgi:NAD(P)-dependent dehydrogenase (short-subunit alcohol dehydrogenase family)
MDAIKSTIAENFGGAAHSVADQSDQFDIKKDVPDLSGKVALITGGSEGIGYATAYTLLKANVAKIFIVSISEDVKDEAVESVRTQLSSEHADRITWFQCDMSDLTAVADVAKQVRSQTDRLDIYCQNAARGIMTYQTTSYGIDRHMAVNHIGHVVLTSHLLPLLKSTSEKSTVRIQIQASNAHQATPSDCKFASIEELNTDLGPNGQYGRSKLAGILYARYLDRHLHSSHSKILINATHPGFVDTKMSTEDIHEPYPILGYGMSKGMQPFKKDIWMGCVSTVFAATKTETSGKYICPPAIEEPGSELAQDEQLGERLMELTRNIVKEKFGQESVDKGCPLKDY